MRRRGQGAFEYVLLLAGILLVAVIAVLILRSNVFPSVNSQIGNNTQAYNVVTCIKPWEANPSNVIALYHFNDGAGTSVRDESGNGNTGLINGNAPVWLSGNSCSRPGSCLQFDGATNYVTVPTPSGLGITGPFTITAWVKTSRGADMGIVSQWNGAFGGTGYLMWINANVLQGVINNNYAVGTTLVNTNNWVHLAVEYDGTSDRVFVNGKQDASTASTPPAIAATPFEIGSYAGPGRWFNGVMDEVAVYNRALSAQEIMNDYQCHG